MFQAVVSVWNGHQERAIFDQELSSNPRFYRQEHTLKDVANHSPKALGPICSETEFGEIRNN